MARGCRLPSAARDELPDHVQLSTSSIARMFAGQLRLRFGADIGIDHLPYSGVPCVTPCT